MLEWLNVIVLGIVEGITEFLPISSTGHLIVASRIFPTSAALDGVFEIFIQIGAVVAVMLFYRKQLWQHARTFHKDRETRKLWVGVFVAFLPATILGLLFIDQIDAVLFKPGVVAAALIVGGIFFLIAERTPQNSGEDTLVSVEQQPLTLRQALIVGLWQVLALIPGMSRSGMSILGGMAAGVERARATQFSFYLALPTLGGATVYTLLKNLSQISTEELGMLLLGAVVSGVVAWLSIGWLLRYIARNSFVPFGWYRILVGIVILLVESNILAGLSR